ncbi:MAG: GntR family transcriptional regulator [Burkholderiales bacterium]|nr:GntR family transcriptional regulator [Burkholderiales bacterium]
MARAAGGSASREPRVRAARGAEQIYERLKSMAITFAIRPDARVNEVELSRALNVSRTPLREALNRLMVEGFLTRAPNRGFIGRSLDAKQIYDLYELRRSLEESIVRLACERASGEDLAGLEAFVKDSIARREKEDTASLLALDEAFHERVAELTRNREMVRALKAINARIHFVRWLDMKRRYTQQDHLRIVRALRARDAARAAGLVEEHISRRLDQIVEVIRMGYAEIYTRGEAAER